MSLSFFIYKDTNQFQDLFNSSQESRLLMNQQEPFYFQIIPRTLISKSFEKEGGEFKFHIYKESQRMDSSKDSYPAKFDQQNRLTIEGTKLNFYLNNYISTKRAKFTLKLSKVSKHKAEQLIEQQDIDINSYIEKFKQKGENHYSLLIEFGGQYCLEMEMYLEESRFMLEKILRQNRGEVATIFSKPLVSNQFLSSSRKSEDEQREWENEDRYKEQRLEKFNNLHIGKITTAGYRLDKPQQKEAHQQSSLSNLQSAQSNKVDIQESQKRKAHSFKMQASQKGSDSHEESMFSVKKIVVIAFLLLILGGLSFWMYSSVKDSNRTVNDIGPSDIGGQKKQSAKQKRTKQKKRVSPQQVISEIDDKILEPQKKKRSKKQLKSPQKVEKQEDLSQTQLQNSQQNQEKLMENFEESKAKEKTQINSEKSLKGKSSPKNKKKDKKYKGRSKKQKTDSMPEEQL